MSLETSCDVVIETMRGNFVPDDEIPSSTTALDYFFAITGLGFIYGTLIVYIIVRHRMDYNRLKVRPLLLTCVPVLGFTLCFVWGPIYSIIGSSTLSCRLSLWIRTLTIPLVTIPLSVRILYYYTQVSLSKKIAGQYETGRKMSKESVKVDVEKRETVRSIHLSRNESDLQVANNSNLADARVSSISVQEAKGPDSPRVSGLSSVPGSNSGYSFSMSHVGFINRLSETAFSLSLSLILLLPFVAGAVYQRLSLPQYILNCFGCLPSAGEYLAWFFAYSGFGMMSGYVLFKLRQDPDPLGIRFELMAIIVYSVCTGGLGLILLVFEHDLQDSRVVNWVWILNVCCVGMHFFSCPYQIYVAYKESKENRSARLSTSSTVSNARPIESINLAKLVTEKADTELGRLFESHVIAELCTENMEFIRAVRYYKNRFLDLKPAFRQKRAIEIYERYIKLGAYSEINISSDTRDYYTRIFKDESIKLDKFGFTRAENDALQLLESNSWSRFSRSPEFLNYQERLGKTVHVEVELVAVSPVI